MAYGLRCSYEKKSSTKIENNYISEDDKLLSDFHSLDSQGKSAVRFILDNELKRIKKENELESKLFEIKKIQQYRSYKNLGLLWKIGCGR